MNILASLSRSSGSGEGTAAEEARESPAQERAEHAARGASRPGQGGLVDLMA